MMMIIMMMVTMIMSVATAHSIVYVIYCTPHCEGVLAIPYQHVVGHLHESYPGNHGKIDGIYSHVHSIAYNGGVSV
jgi:hypothetical protein